MSLLNRRHQLSHDLFTLSKELDRLDIPVPNPPLELYFVSQLTHKRGARVDDLACVGVPSPVAAWVCKRSRPMTYGVRSHELPHFSFCY